MALSTTTILPLMPFGAPSTPSAKERIPDLQASPGKGRESGPKREFRAYTDIGCSRQPRYIGIGGAGG